MFVCGTVFIQNMFARDPRVTRLALLFLARLLGFSKFLIFATCNPWLTLCQRVMRRLRDSWRKCLVYVGFRTGIGRVRNSNTGPVTVHTVTVPGTGRHRPVIPKVSYKTRGYSRLQG